MKKETKRWLVVAGALLVQICLGAIYSWSVFVKPLEDTFHFTRTQTQIIFSVALATFALVMIFAGKWQDRAGPKKVAITGGIVLGLGYILAGSLAVYVPPSLIFYFITGTVGLIGGAGIGFAYVCPIAACVKWFPDKRGLITGLAVAGFGGGAWIFAKLATSLIGSYGVIQTFLYLGLIFLIAVSAGSLTLSNPPKNWKPKRWKAAKKKTNKKASKENFTWQEMVKTSQFWSLWSMYMFGAAAGLLVIGNLKPFGVFSGMSAEVAGSAVGILALFNAAGRIMWGMISDRIGRTKSMLIMFLLQGGMMLSLMKMGASPLLLGIAAAWVGFNFGGNFALFPSATVDFFGTQNLGVNYGFVFTSYGVAGIVGPILGGSVFDLTGSYLYAFIPAGIVCLIAAGLSLITKHPFHK
ncbi:OFA family MFS transporter [Candidatus Woesearchaeota archaeon]|nr:OFA family MFS transporter [Candidatus Woesearchaeota archaeon]